MHEASPRFICAASGVTCLEIAEAIVDDVTETLEQGVLWVDPQGNPIVFAGTVAYLMGDGPKLSIFASHRGSLCRWLCWFYYHDAKDLSSSVEKVGKRRDPKSPLQLIAEMRTDPSSATPEKAKCVAQGENPLFRLRHINIHQTAIVGAVASGQEATAAAPSLSSSSFKSANTGLALADHGDSHDSDPKQGDSVPPGTATTNEADSIQSDPYGHCASSATTTATSSMVIAEPPVAHLWIQANVTLSNCLSSLLFATAKCPSTAYGVTHEFLKLVAPDQITDKVVAYVTIVPTEANSVRSWSEKLVVSLQIVPQGANNVLVKAHAFAVMQAYFPRDCKSTMVTDMIFDQTITVQQLLALFEAHVFGAEVPGVLSTTVALPFPHAKSEANTIADVTSRPKADRSRDGTSSNNNNRQGNGNRATNARDAWGRFGNGNSNHNNRRNGNRQDTANAPTPDEPRVHGAAVLVDTDSTPRPCAYCSYAFEGRDAPDLMHTTSDCHLAWCYSCVGAILASGVRALLDPPLAKTTLSDAMARPFAVLLAIIESLGRCDPPAREVTYAYNVARGLGANLDNVRNLSGKQSPTEAAQKAVASLYWHCNEFVAASKSLLDGDRPFLLAPAEDPGRHHCVAASSSKVLAPGDLRHTLGVVKSKDCSS